MLYKILKNALGNLEKYSKKFRFVFPTLTTTYIYVSYQFCSSPNAATVVTKLNMQMSDIPDKDIGNPNVEVVVVLIIIIAVAADVSITAIANF